MSRKPIVRMLGYTDPRGYQYAVVDLDALVFDFKNPRTPAQESGLESLVALLKQDGDGVFNLATDVVAQRGTNPAELPNVSPLPADALHYTVREGNRRLAVRKLLRNPQQLKNHVSDADLRRWTTLADSPEAKALPDEIVVVIGEDHEHWVDRRHLGPQGGKGLVSWDTEAKRRRDQRRTGEQDLALQVLDGLKEHHADQFADLEPPPRTFTTFARLIESEPARAELGLDVDETGRLVLRHGKQSLRMLEEILRDLRKKGNEKLTSRRIHSTGEILDYLTKTKKRIPTALAATPITLPTPAPRTTGASTSTATGALAKVAKDVMRAMNPPKGDRRLKAIFDELRDARKRDMPNAAIVLTRVLIELSVDAYAKRHGLAFAGDVDPKLESALPAFYKALNDGHVRLPPEVKEGLRWAKTKPMSLSSKLEASIADLVQRNIMSAKDGAAKQRDIRSTEVLPMLNDAVHRLNVVPSLARVNHILEVVHPVYNAITQV